MESCSDNNQRTINSYNKLWEDYIYSHNRIEWVGDWLQRSVKNLDKSSKIFEIGSGSGNDARYLQSLGYRVEVSDAVPAFVDYLNGRGFDARQFNALTDEFPDNRDLILAAAVLQHLNVQQFEAVVGKIFDSLLPGGRFAFQMIEGEGENIIEDDDFYSYICFWSPDNLSQALEEVGFQQITSFETQEEFCDGRSMVWLSGVAEKPQNTPYRFIGRRSS